MIAFRLALFSFGAFCLASISSGQLVQLQTTPIEQPSLYQPEAETSRNLMRQPIETPQPTIVSQHVGDLHEVESQHHDALHDDAPEAWGTPMHLEPIPSAHAPHADELPVAEGCNCGDEKHCHGVCTDPGRPKKPKRDKPGDINRGDCPPLRYRMDDCRRAGNPNHVACWAKCSVNDKYSSWFVGGGAAFFRGRCRKPTEGTWGLDYDGFFGHVNNWLTYTRGRKQGGEGAYETDGEPAFVSRAHELIGIGH